MNRAFSLWKISSSALRFFPRDFLIKHSETVDKFYIGIILWYYYLSYNIIYQVWTNIMFSTKVLTIHRKHIVTVLRLCTCALVRMRPHTSYPFALHIYNNRYRCKPCAAWREATCRHRTGLTIYALFDFREKRGSDK